MKRNPSAPHPALLALILFLEAALAHADWPMLGGNPRHDGFSPSDPKPPYRLAWARSFLHDRLGTAAEPIVAGQLVFLTTHRGQLLALHADSGQPAWRFQAHGPFLHAPACAEGLVLAASIDGRLYALDALHGHLRWHSPEFPGGFSASPTIDHHHVFIGTRSGTFLAFNLHDGQLLWQHSLGVPIRQTAAAAHPRAWITGEDLRLRCFLSDGTLSWTSAPLRGQTARDYYPVVVSSSNQTRIIVRTNPNLNMAQRLARDRQFLARQAGADDRDWRTLEAWIKSDAARGAPELWQREQDATRHYLTQDPDAQTFYVFDGLTGQPQPTAPILWAAGCQASGAPPRLTADGRLLVFHRSAYGNWNRGVAPLVALGLLNLADHRVEPLFHQSGPQPPWNTFWGTADESQNFTVAQHTVLIAHQGTLSGFHLPSSQLFPIHGERDTFGGFTAPAWTRNEWHGPARGGVAIAGPRLFWITGSRLLCLTSEPTPPTPPTQTESCLDLAQVPGTLAPNLTPIVTTNLSLQLAQAVRELASQLWAPLWIEPGLAGREFLYDHNASIFESLAWAFPFLPADLQTQVKRWLAEEWDNFPPYTSTAEQPLDRGARREWAPPPRSHLTRTATPPATHPFGNLHAIALYANRCRETTHVLRAWPRLRACFEDFERSQWTLPPQGDLRANRYLASLLAFASLAEQANDPDVAARASALAETTTEALLAWWQRAAAEASFTELKGVEELDPFIGRGSAFSFRLSPHRHKLALFHDLTPAVAQRLQTGAPDAVGQVWNWFDTVYRTWPLQGEERQVHYGENFVDPPDLAAGAFRALAFIQNPTPGYLARRIDLPFAKADLDYITKLALTLEAARPQSDPTQVTPHSP